MPNVIDYPLRPVIVGTLDSMLATTGSHGQSFYNTTYFAYFDWVVDRWWPRQPDPRYGFVLPHEDFCGTDRIGTNDWNSTGTITSTVGLATRPGVYIVRQATASSLSLLRTDVSAFQLGTGDFYFETGVNIPTLATGVEDFVFTWGLNDGFNYQVNGDCTDGADFRLDRATNGANWITNTTNNGSKDAKNSSTAVVAGTFYRLGILASATNSNVTFYVDGNLIATHTAQIPTGAGRGSGLIWTIDKTLGSTARDIQLDYFSGWGFFRQARAA